MTEWIIHYKWYFFIIGEVVFWLTLIGFLVLRYYFELTKWSKWLVFIFILNDLWLVAIGTIDYFYTGKMEKFQFIIIIFVLYALTFGKKDFLRLDQYIRHKVAKWKGLTVPEDHVKEPKLFGYAHAWKETKFLAIHLVLYIVALMICFILFGLSVSLDQWIEQVGEKFEAGDIGLFRNETANQICTVWTFILVIDLIVTISYWLFPKKEKSRPKENIND